MATTLRHNDHIQTHWTTDGPSGARVHHGGAGPFLGELPPTSNHGPTDSVIDLGPVWEWGGVW
jgi:hypothetical protein